MHLYGFFIAMCIFFFYSLKTVSDMHCFGAQEAVNEDFLKLADLLWSTVANLAFAKQKKPVYLYAKKLSYRLLPSHYPLVSHGTSKIGSGHWRSVVAHGKYKKKPFLSSCA